MADEVESMVAVVNENELGRDVPWHRLGNQAAQVLTKDEALTLGGLDWTVGTYPVLTRNPKTQELVTVPRTYAVTRESDGSVFGSVGEFYTPIQNSEMLEFGEALVDTSKGHAHWDTAGSLRGGAVTFASFKVSDIEGLKVGGKDSEQLDLYLLVTTSHDGSKAFRAAIVPIRVVCMNTLQWALGANKANISIRHTKNWAGKLAEAQRALDLTVAYVAEFDQVSQRLMEIDTDLDEIKGYVDSWIPLPEKKGRDRAEEQRDGLLGNILGTKTVEDDLKGTRYGVLQGATEWAEHDRPVRLVQSGRQSGISAGEARFNSVLLSDDGPVRHFRERVFKDLTKDLGPDVLKHDRAGAAKKLVLA